MKVEFYEKENGERPALDFLDSLDIKSRNKMMMTIRLLQERGNSLREPYSKHLDGEILELRSKQGSNITRILYFFFIGEKAILTNGFVKKTQKTPQNEIVKANKYRDDYCRRAKK